MKRGLMMLLSASLVVTMLAGSALAEGLNGRDGSLECNFYVPNYNQEKLMAFRQKLSTETNNAEKVLTVVNRCTRRPEQLSIEAINVTESTGDMRIEGTVLDPTGPETAKRAIDIIK